MGAIGEELLSWFEQPVYREKVTRVVSMWVNEHFCDFDSNRDLLNFLEKIETRLEEKHMFITLSLLTLVAYCSSRQSVPHLTTVAGDGPPCGTFRQSGPASTGHS